MKKVKLANGLTVLFKKKEGNSVVIEVMAKVGSNNESPQERGLSHLLEHMIFEGTTKRTSNWLISNEIEKIGGELNAYTTHERTCFYIKVLKKHFSIAVEVLADILKNSLFTDKDIQKEKNIVLKEIDLVNDEPRYYQWELLQKTLYDKHPVRYPVYGDKKIIKKLGRKEVVNYFKKYYGPSNLVVSIVGDIPNWKQEIERNFALTKSVPLKVIKTIEPEIKRNREKKEKRKINNTYAVMAFKTIPRGHPDSYVIDVINGILGRGQSGRMFTEIRAKKGLAYDVGTQNVGDATYGYFAIYATINKKNLAIVKQTILEEINKLKELKQKDLLEAITYVEGDFLLALEDSQKVADQILFWQQAKDAKLMNSFVKNVKKVTLNDVRRVINKYFKNHALAVVEGKS